MRKPTPKSVLFFSLAIVPACLGLAETVAILSVTDARAADFAHAKQVYVPASRIRRRFDSEMREASPYAAIDPGTGSAIGTAYSSMAPLSFSPPTNFTPPASTSKPSKYGLIPPPPPVTPSIIPGPASMTVPPIDSAGSYRPGFGLPSLPHVNSTAPVSPSVGARAKQQLNQLINEGKLSDAHEVIRNYLKSYPKDQPLRNDIVSTLVEHGKTYANAKESDNAARLAREALLVEPQNTAASQLLSDALKKEGIDPGNAQERMQIGESLAQQGRQSEAMVEFRAANKIKPSAAAHIGIGNGLLKDGKKEWAKVEYQKALEIEPNSPVALRQLGILRYSANDIVGASADLSRALILNPEDKIASRTLIDLWQHQVSKNPRDANSHLGLARAYQLSGDLKSAQNEYKQVVRLDPENPNLPAARQSFKLALARQEAHKSYLAAQTLETSGALREAHSKIVEAAGLAPTDTKIRLYEGDLAKRLGLFNQAHDAYMAVLKEDPKNATAAEKLKELAALKAKAQMPPLAPAQGMASSAVLNFLNRPFNVRPGEALPAPSIAPP
ncbi:MAG TPA: hypothetical protein V6D17_14815, partial [Candidatus Obscuribacterales bacterium]